MADEQDDKPAFGEVVKAFTPAGMDFDEFREALHSQGAPGMISPEMVAILNHSGIGEAMAHSGPACPRCDHPHGGPPGPACLEAERRYGRSPLRRSPDLQLDEIRGPSQSGRVFAGPGMPLAVTPGTASVAAIAANEMFTDFIRAGFTEDQALKLTALIITHHSNDDSEEPQ